MDKTRRRKVDQVSDESAPVRDDIYNLETAASRCRVSKDQVIKWIGLGLRAFPLGESVEYRARDYVILEEWLLDFFRGRGVVTPGGEKGKAADRKKESKPKGVTKDQPLGPRPT
jgi:hypothetical protein